MMFHSQTPLEANKAKSGDVPKKDAAKKPATGKKQEHA